MIILNFSEREKICGTRNIFDGRPVWIFLCFIFLHDFTKTYLTFILMFNVHFVNSFYKKSRK